MNYAAENDYMTFILNQRMEQAKIDKYINECILISEGGLTYNSMQVLNEGVVESFKAKMTKLAEFLKKMWAKFLEAMNGLIRSNKGYLDKYKDIILKKKPQDGVSYTMYKYDPDGVNRIKLPLNMQFTDEKTLIADASDKDKYIAKLFGDMISKTGAKAPYDFQEICKNFFHVSAEPVEVKSSELNMTNLFNYCYTYESSIKRVLENDLKRFNDNMAKQVDILSKYTAENSSTDNHQQTQSNTSSGNQQQTQSNNQNNGIDVNKPLGANMNSGKPNNEAFYSDVYGRYITEEVKVNKPDGNQQQSGAATPNTGTGTTGSVKPNNDTQDRNKANIDSKNINQDNVKQLTDAIDVYGEIGRIYLTTRMSIAEAIYKDYMSIIRDHVKSHVGINDQSKNTAQRASTNNTKTNDNPFNNNINNTQPQENQQGQK